MWPLFGESEGERRQREREEYRENIRMQTEANRTYIEDTQRRAYQEKKDRRQAYWDSPEGQDQTRFERSFNRNIIHEMYYIWFGRVFEILSNKLFKRRNIIRLGHYLSIIVWILVIFGIISFQFNLYDREISFALVGCTMLATFVYSLDKAKRLAGR
jgi:hypothetical protein